MGSKRITPFAVGGFATVVGFLISARLRRPVLRSRDDGWPASLAHRGASAHAPENTLEAYRLAVESGAGGLELDVHMTRDGQVVVMHDDVVDRLTDGAGPIREKTLKELENLDAGYYFSPDAGSTFPYRGSGLKIPTLQEVLQQFPNTPINLDIKEDQSGFEEAVLRIIQDNGAENRTFVASQKYRVARRFRKLSNGAISTSSSQFEVGVFLLLSRLRLERLLRPGFAALQVPTSYRGIELVTPRFISAAHDLGVRVDVWTIDDSEEIHRLLDLGVDVIMTNRPEVLTEVLEQRREVRVEDHERYGDHPD